MSVLPLCLCLLMVVCVAPSSAGTLQRDDVQALLDILGHDSHGKREEVDADETCVTVYASSNYRDKLQKYCNNVRALDSNDEKITSLKLSANTAIRVYYDTKYSGNCYYIDADVDFSKEMQCLNNQISSIKFVQPMAETETGCVTVYDSQCYQNEMRKYCGNMLQLGSLHDDKITSLKLGPDTAIMIYYEANYRGLEFYIDADVDFNQERKSWNNQISSFKFVTKQT